jgi:universal stress protein A
MTPMKRILVPTDFSATSDIAVEYAIDAARRHGASVHVLHALEDGPYPIVYPDSFAVELAMLRREATEKAEDHLASVARRFESASVPVTTQVIVGHPVQMITRTARDRGVDLIVMGTHGRTGFAHLMLGSVAERVLRTAPCPVLTVRDTARVAEALAGELAADQTPIQTPA